ncbi:60S ribosomal protein L19 [Metarhizium album ARSEF 1941]|uniref:60S ribosomal protein L19 n=1 Tax=Metarhizium album (strain ARSEF 1941) TaxID=1081103 RepID=A0A0B2WK85_METAS|nr:60S ribosomal protein L19 [Metarhizium album ARSEF 1941]KHN94094.1 60S ribosomal protein L19 [Metarhizium album ARSEF 1941]
MEASDTPANTAPLPHSPQPTRTLKHYSQVGNAVSAHLMRSVEWLDSPQGRGVLKCTFAYTLASLSTFVGPLSDFLGRPDGKHVVATITVYFHAARSAGSMIEAILVAIIAVAYAEVISILSMVVSVIVGARMGLVTVAHALVIVVFIGGGFGFMGWVKQRMNNPLVNVGSTLASIAIISVVTKENAVVYNVFSNQKIAQVLKMLAMGITSTAAVNLLIWPVSARTQLRTSMTKASMALGHVLTPVNSSFLRGDAWHDHPSDISRASSVYKQVHVTLVTNLREAKFEHYCLGREKVCVVERSIVQAIETLAQSLGGLRSAAKTQQTLLNSIATDPSHFASDLFEIFANMIRPSMQVLTETLSLVLREPVFGGPPEHEIHINESFRSALTASLATFTESRADALQCVYDLVAQNSDSYRSSNNIALEEMAAACGHFSFSLQSFGEEIQKYMDMIEDLRYVKHHSKRSWMWLLWWRAEAYRGYSMSAPPFQVSASESLIQPIKKPYAPRGITKTMLQRRDTYSWQAAPDKNKWLAGISRTLLKILRGVARDDILFGIKVGIGASLWAMFAFLDATRPTYNHYRGEWGLLSFMIVCSMTVGASNTTGWSRFVGTFLGAAFSIINWNLSQGNAVVLAILGWAISFFNFYLIVARGQAPLGRMTILAYNVSTLYAYSLSQKVDDADDDEGGVHPLIMEIVKHRAISVTTGILWGLIVCRVIWPISARKKFKEGISVLLLQMGLIWRRGPLAILLRSDCSQSYLKSGEQAALQRYADRLEGLRQSAASEFELRGPFPFQANGRILQSANRILDSFFAMSLVTQPRARLTPGEKALLRATAEERAVLCDRVCHIFQVVASSMTLEYALTDAIPNILANRDRLLSKISRFREENMAALRANLDRTRSGSACGIRLCHTENEASAVVVEDDYALLYAYVLVTGQVADELKIVAAEIESLFGVFSGDLALLE